MGCHAVRGRRGARVLRAGLHALLPGRKHGVAARLHPGPAPADIALPAMIDAIPFSDDPPGLPPVRGQLYAPATRTGEGLVLTHGAGGNSRSAVLIAMAQTCAEAGFQVLCCDMPFRQARASGPPSPGGAARDRAGLDAAVKSLHRLGVTDTILGGLSYGGRQASMLAADEPEIARGLLLLSYPLHPPGRPEQARTAHLPRLRTPAVFVSGTRDPFGSPEELRQALALVPAPTTFVEIDGAGHDLSRGRRSAAETHREVAGRSLRESRAPIRTI